MEMMQTVLNRRSVRKYTGEPVPDAQVHQILQAGLLAPTSQNRKPCEFYVIRNKETFAALSKAKKFGAGMLSGCDVAIAVVADSKKADTWVEDCTVAMTYMNLMAASLGVGSCWCQMYQRSSILGKDAEETTKAALNIADKNQRLVGLVALGVPEKEPQPHTEEDADWAKVHTL